MSHRVDNKRKPPSPEFPTWEACRVKENGGYRLTHLERFIYNNEPTAIYPKAIWRRELEAALNEMKSKTVAITDA